jgi:hypothetical protein
MGGCTPCDQRLRPTLHLTDFCRASGTCTLSPGVQIDPEAPGGTLSGYFQLGPNQSVTVPAAALPRAPFLVVSTQEVGLPAVTDGGLVVDESRGKWPFELSFDGAPAACTPTDSGFLLQCDLPPDLASIQLVVGDAPPDPVGSPSTSPSVFIGLDLYEDPPPAHLCPQ